MIQIWDETQSLFREVSFLQSWECANSPPWISSCVSGWVRPRSRRRVGKLPAGIDRQSRTGKVTRPPSEAVESDGSSRWCFPNTNTPVESGERAGATHLLRRRRSDVPECISADLWPPLWSDASSISICTHAYRWAAVRAREIRRWKCVCGKSCCCVLRAAH